MVEYHFPAPPEVEYLDELLLLGWRLPMYFMIPINTVPWSAVERQTVITAALIF